MATKYVSNSATNGFAVGNDANTATDPLTDCVLTVTRALAVAGAGDTIYINDGTYSEASYIAPVDANLIITPYSDYGVTIQAASGTTRVMHLAATATGISVGKIILDAQATQQYCITLDSANPVPVVTIDGSGMINFTIAGIGSATKARTITFTNGWYSNVSGGSSANVVGLDLKPDAAATITVENGSVSLSTNSSTSAQGMLIQPSVTGCSATVSGNTVRVTQTGAQAGNATTGITVDNCSTVSVHDNDVLLTIGGDISTYACIKVPDDASIACVANIYKNTVRGPGGTEAGYGIACGTDGAGQNTLTANVYSNWVYDVNHAILLGGSTGCKAWSNYEENVSYGVVLKHSTSCLYYGNIVKSPTINGILFKYDTNSAAYYNTVIADVARSSSSVRVTNDGVNNSSGCLIKGNLVVTSDATNAYVILVDAGNAVSSIDFNGWDNTGASGLKWDYNGTDYTTLSAWNAVATVGTDFTGTASLSATYMPGSDFKDKGTWIAGVKAMDDLPLPLRPDIGAVQDRSAPGRRSGPGGRL